MSDGQKERLIQLIQNNFLKTVGRFSGLNGVELKRKLWGTYARELNTLGPSKTVEQWKNVRSNNVKPNSNEKLQ